MAPLHWNNALYFFRNIPICAMLCMAASFVPIQARALEDGALPSGASVLSGATDLSYSDLKLDITQHSERTVINWDSFNIGKSAGVAFHQPGASSIAVNRITGGGIDPTQILGSLTANGRIVVLDPNGVIFGQGSRVDVGGIIASTGTIDDKAFMAGGSIRLQNINTGHGIENYGHVTVADAGLAAFVAPHVVNNGLIEAKMGQVVMASGAKATLDFYGDGLMELAADSDTLSGMVVNHGIISASGGDVVLKAAAARQVVDNVVMNTGIIIASGANVDNAGRITLFAEGVNAVSDNTPNNKQKKSGASVTYNSGILDAAGPDDKQTGGAINILGDNIIVDARSSLNASGDLGGGNIKIGGDYLGRGDTPAAMFTYVDQNAFIFNDAHVSGDGGRTIIWSDGTTEFHGNVFARGGIEGGNGGFLETSGKVNLLADGYADLTNRADGYHKGTYLLDPADITIIKSGAYIDSLDDMTGLANGTYMVKANGESYTGYLETNASGTWLLMGRGRESWDFDADGEGGQDNITEGLGTSAAFDPKSYSTAFINSLIGNTGIDLTDTQIRLKRATNTTGTSYQEMRWDPLVQTSWTWDFDGANYAVNVVADASTLGAGFTFNNAQTRDMYNGGGNDYRRVWTFQWSGKGNIQGFSYGSNVVGVDNNNTTTFLWENTNENHSTPYTEIYLRLADGDPPPINESMAGVNPANVWTIYRSEDNGKKTLYGGANHRIFAPSGSDDRARQNDGRSAARDRRDGEYVLPLAQGIWWHGYGSGPQAERA